MSLKKEIIITECNRDGAKINEEYILNRIYQKENDIIKFVISKA